MTTLRIAAAGAMLSVWSAAVLAAGPATAPDRQAGGGLARAADVRGGLCVLVGCGDETLAADLAKAGRGERFLVQAIDDDAGRVEKTRANLRQAGLLANGTASADVSAASELPYCDNLINLLVIANRAGAAGPAKGGLTFSEAVRALAPGGAVCVKVSDAAAAESAKAGLAATGLKDVASFQCDGLWVKARKPAPAGADEWTHARHAPDGNKVSHDKLIGVPDRLQWLAEPTWSRSHGLFGSVKGMVTSGGRVFYVYDEAPICVAGPADFQLVARDAFSGLVLWRRPIKTRVKLPSGEGRDIEFNPANLVAAGDRVYTVLEPKGELHALDAATGETVRVYDQAGSPDQVVLVNGQLLVCAPGWVWLVDAASGQLKWKYDVMAALKPRSPLIRDLIVGNGQVFFQVDWKTLVCLDLASGREVWNRSMGDWANGGRMKLCLYDGGRLILGGQQGGKGVHGVSAADGQHLWAFNYEPMVGSLGPSDLYLVDRLIWVNAKDKDDWASIGLDPATGKESRRVQFPAFYPTTRGHHRCYMNIATDQFLLLGTRSTDFVDVRAGRVEECKIFRGDCGQGILPANGLIYSPPHSCTCDSQTVVRGLAAMASSAAGATGRPQAPRAEEHPLVRGPAFGAALAGTAEAGQGEFDWPTYRHDGRRTGATAAAGPADLGLLWQAATDGRPTAPVVAGGTVFIASLDSHQVTALAAGAGEVRWRFVAGGPVDSPPTIYRGLCLFGSTDGWVYCLRASDGQLAWRFRAAPGDRRMIAFDRLESPAPVHGSVLVDGGVAFVAAGRYTGLDGGVRTFALDPASGKVLWQSQAIGCGDVLVRGPKGINLAYSEIDPATGECRKPTSHEYLRSRNNTLLDDAMPVRGRWDNLRAEGEILVFNDQTTLAASAFPDSGKDTMTKLGQSQNKLFATAGGGKQAWSAPLPLRARAMALAGGTLFLAGTPDTTDAADPYGAVRGRKGGQLWAVSAGDGAKLKEGTLAAAPVFDGMAVAGWRLFVATEDGKVLCFGSKGESH